MKPKATVTPTTAEDVAEFLHEPVPCRIRALTGRVDGKIVAIGGLAYLGNGAVTAFLEASDEARKYPIALHKAGLDIMRMAREKGHPTVFTEVDDGIEAADRWLKRLGFEPLEDGGWQWQSSQR